MCRRFLTLLIACALCLSQVAVGGRAQGRPAVGAQTGGPAQAQQPAPVTPPPASVPVATPQQPFPLLDKKSEKIKRAVSRIGVGERLTVIIKHGDDLHGTVTQVGADAFLLAEVDRHEVLTVLYRDVEKVRSGYNGVNVFTGKHANSSRGLEIGLFAGVVALLVVPLIIYAAGSPD
jgi:hypothetical protein